MKKNTWTVHKFGGTSVANAERYLGVAKILSKLAANAPEQRRGIVVSAMKGVTDALIRLVELAAQRDKSYLTELETLRKRHLDTASQLLKSAALSALVQQLESDFSDIRDILRGVWVARTASDRIIELVSGFGEVWSAQILNAVLKEQGKQSEWLDTRGVLVVEPFEKYVVVDWKTSAERLKTWLSVTPQPWIVITGFVASTNQGVATTLRRNGSDFSGSIFGALLEATEVVIWTDVDGVLSADPRLVPEAVVLNELSYQEVTELAYFGAKVVHPATMEPAIRRNIPIWIKNTFNPDFPGTKIHGAATSSHEVKGFSAIEDMALINIEGTGMVGIPGVAEKLFGALRGAGISVVMISQASSEQSICFAIPANQVSPAKKAVEQEFYGEIAQGLIQKVEVTSDCSILAVVGDSMAKSPGVAGRFFSILGRAGVNIRAIAQGSSERNISVVISHEDTHKALKAAHSAFFRTHTALSIGLIGTGLIGKELLAQLHGELENVRKQRNFDLRIRAIANSSRMLLDPTRISLADWKDRFEKDARAIDLGAFVDHLQLDPTTPAVIIDATASEEVSRNYAAWLRRGVHVITPNKKANTATWDSYRELREAQQDGKTQLFYSANVGAGLPVIQTLRDLIQTGDRVLRIEGVLSGTLSFLFNSLQGSAKFSEIVKDAMSRGYTEPDPREDLSGMDVARKLTILARELGMPLEVSDVALESLVPTELEKLPLAEFLRRLPEHDEVFGKRLGNLGSGEVLRYVGTIDPAEGRVSVALKSFPAAHPFSRLSGTDNIVSFRTARYDRQPLVIQGPGAGPQVTAAGVFSDLLRVSHLLGGHR